MNDTMTIFAINFIATIGIIFLIVVVVLLITAFILYQNDKKQTAQTIRRNYPLIGRFRYIFEHLGEFFRQYFFAMDREELPFNRAQLRISIIPLRLVRHVTYAAPAPITFLTALFQRSQRTLHNHNRRV